MDSNPRIYGAPPFNLVLVHGGPGGGGDMAPIGRRLASSFGILEPIQTAHSITGQIEELRQAINEHTTERIILAGHSWGAWLAIFLAAEYPNLVEKLILIGSGPLEERYVPEFRRRLDAQLSEAEREELLGVRQRAAISDGTERQRLFERLGELSNKGYDFDRVHEFLLPGDEVPLNADLHSQVWGEAKQQRSDGRLLEYLSRLSCPVFVIHGDYDPHPVEGVTDPLEKAGKLTGAVILKNCGHSPWLERQASEAFYSQLQKWIEIS